MASCQAVPLFVCVYFFENNHQAYKSRDFSVEFFQKKIPKQRFPCFSLDFIGFFCVTITSD